MAKVKELSNKLSEAKHGEFKSGDFVFYVSAQGPQYNCFAKVIDYTLDGKVLIEILLKSDGRQEIEDIVETGNTKEVNEYSLRLGKDMLNNKIETTKMKLARLEQLQKEI